LEVQIAVPNARGFVDELTACLPIIERELRVALRKQRPVQRRLKAACFLAIGALLFLWFSVKTGDRSASRTLHHLLCFAGLYFILQVPRLTAGVIADERREKTLGLLFLSGLGAGDVFVSKLFSSALIALTELLALVPLLALPFLMGGVSFDLFLATAFTLPNLFLLALALSLLASVLCKEDGAALMLAWALGLGLCLLPLLLYVAKATFSNSGATSSWLLRLSPAYGPYLIWADLPATLKSEFWKNFGFTLLSSGACLVLAVVTLAKVWREPQEYSRVGGWLERWQELAHGNARWRGQLAARWLETNPFAWLAAHDRQPAMLAWLAVGGIAGVWLLCWAAWPLKWISVPNAFITATLLNMAVWWICRLATANSLGNPRRDGSYEVLLTTPLTPKDIVSGELAGLRQLFRPVVMVVLALNVALLLSALVTRSWNARSLLVYVSIWFFLLRWVWMLQFQTREVVLPVMWVSLNCGRPFYAVWRLSGLNSWTWIWIVFNFRFLLGGISRFPTGSAAEFFIVSLVATVGMMVHLFRVYEIPKVWERRLIAEFREVAREPLPHPHDPRFKKWDVRQRFPWGWHMAQEQLHERAARREADLELSRRSFVRFRWKKVRRHGASRTG
jgi:hypothetical protein